MAGRGPDAPNALATARGMPRTGTQAHRHGATPGCGASRRPGAGGQTRVGWASSWPSTPRSRGPRAGGRGEAMRPGRRGGSGCPLVSAPWRLALSVWSLRLLLAHRSHHPRARRVTREALSAQQISSFRENRTRKLGGERERGGPRENRDAWQRGEGQLGP